MITTTMYIGLFFASCSLLSIIINTTIFQTHLAIVCAKLINLYSGLTILLMSRRLISKIPIQFFKNLHNSENSINVHFIILFNIIILSILHVVAHYYSFLINDTRFGSLFEFWSNPSIFTGNILFFLMFLLIPGLQFLSRRSVIFIWVHHTFILLYFILLLSHGCFCYLLLKDGTCRNPQSWKWSVLPLFIYCIDLILRYNTKSINIKKVNVYNGNILEINIEKDINLEKILGSTIYVNCPEISLLEWHPFSIVSTKFDNSFTTFYIKERGDWTKSFHKLVGKTESGKYIQSFYPRLKIDGPYGDKFGDIEQLLSCNNVCIYSLGIGFTPFISLFKYMYFSQLQIKKLLIVLTVREFNDLDVIHNILLTLSQEKTIKILIYETDKSKHTIMFDDNNQIQIHHGRPNINQLSKQERIDKLIKIS